MHFSLALLASVATGAAATASETDYEQEFSAWAATYAREYASSEARAQALEVFSKKFDAVTTHNKLRGLGSEAAGVAAPRYSVALNRFSDWSDEDYRAYLTFSQTTVVDEAEAVAAFQKGADARGAADIRESIDWRFADQNPAGIVATTPVKDQGSCGGCWAFATTGAVEGAVAIDDDRSTLNDLSEQQLLDCDTGFNAGCSGGNQEVAYEYVTRNGLDTEKDYMYLERDGICAADSYDPASVVSGYEKISHYDETALMEALNRRPVGVAIAAMSTSFQSYSSGVFDDASCGTQLDHAVLVVGYGTDPVEGDYWTVKNSWGIGWGEDGYVRMARGTSSPYGLCGILIEPSIAVEGVALTNTSSFPVYDDGDDCEWWSFCLDWPTWQYIACFSGLLLMIYAVLTCCWVDKRRRSHEQQMDADIAAAATQSLAGTRQPLLGPGGAAKTL